MPATSKKQYNYIQYIRSKYKSKADAPKQHKWAFDKEWTDVDVKSLPEGTEMGDTYDYNCLMLYTPVNGWNTLHEFIDPDDVLEYENEPHVTVLYGIHGNVDNTSVLRTILSCVKKPIAYEITGVKCFENDEQDVLYLSVASPELNALNAKIKASVEYTSEYDKYIPHMTLCFVKPGCGQKYVKDFGYPIKREAGIFSYSTVNGEKSYWDIFERKSW